MNESNHRSEERYSISFPLLYSPVKSSFEKNLGERLFKAISVDMSLSGMAFDIEEALPVGEKISVIIESPEENLQEKLSCEVCWCRELSPGKYRIGTVIVSMKNRGIEPANTIPSKIISSGEMPKEFEYHCPSCLHTVTFEFIGYQPVLAGKAKIPLYNCPDCNTTRSLTGLLHS